MLDVLRARGVNDAYPLTVKPRILNPRFTERLNDEPFPQTTEQLAQWDADDCHIVVIGHGKGSETEWPAHLVVVIPNALNGRDALCDLTITQANVPDWGIVLGAVLVGVRESLVDGSEDFGVTVNGSRIVYRAFPENQSFKRTPIWTRKLRRNAIVKRVLGRL